MRRLVSLVSLALVTGALIVAVPASAGSKPNRTLGTEANPAGSCSEIENEGNFWVKAPPTPRVGGDGIPAASDRVLTTCKKDGFQLVSQFLDTEADDLTNTQFDQRGVEYGWLSGPSGTSTPMWGRGISGLTTDMPRTSGSFGLGTDVITWMASAHPYTPINFVPGIQFCIFEIKDGHEGKETCSDSTLEADKDRYQPLRENTGGIDGLFFTPPMFPRVRGQAPSRLPTSGAALATLASFGGGLVSSRVAGVTASDTNCWLTGNGDGFGSAGRFCEMGPEANADTADVPAPTSGARGGCAWLGLNTTGDGRTDRLCFRPGGTGQDELVLVTGDDKQGKKVVTYGFRTYAKFWAPGLPADGWAQQPAAAAPVQG